MALINVAIKFGDENFCFGIYVSKFLFKKFFFQIIFSKFFFPKFFTYNFFYPILTSNSAAFVTCWAVKK